MGLRSSIPGGHFGRSGFCFAFVDLLDGVLTFGWLPHSGVLGDAEEGWLLLRLGVFDSGTRFVLQFFFSRGAEGVGGEGLGIGAWSAFELGGFGWFGGWSIAGSLRGWRDWVQLELLQEEEAPGGSVDIARVAGLLAAQKVEGFGVGEYFVRSSETDTFVNFGEFSLESGGLAVHFRFEEADFDDPAAADAPLVDGDLLDAEILHVRGGIVLGDAGFEEALKNLRGLIRQADGVGGDSEFERVPGGDGFALEGFGSAGEESIGAGGEDAAER